MGTVGIVVVAHSRALAEGVAELGRQMGLGEVRVEPAGGDVDGGLGTSIELVEEAVRTADQGAGVVLLADIGSSVLCAKTFIEDADSEVVFADAPLVEGVVAAASAACGGAGLATVARAATEAYDFRKTRLSNGPAEKGLLSAALVPEQEVGRLRHRDDHHEVEEQLQPARVSLYRIGRILRRYITHPPMMSAISRWGLLGLQACRSIRAKNFSTASTTSSAPR